MPSIHPNTESTPINGPNGAAKSYHISHNSQKKNTWTEAGPAAFDFRSIALYSLPLNHHLEART